MCDVKEPDEPPSDQSLAPATEYSMTWFDTVEPLFTAGVQVSVTEASLAVPVGFPGAPGVVRGVTALDGRDQRP